MQLYLAVTPRGAREATQYGRTLAHVAYRIGPGSTLLRQNPNFQTRGGLLSVSDREAPPIGDPDALCAAVLRECGRQGYSGTLLDFEEAPRRDRLEFARRLVPALAAGRRTLYLPERYAQAAENGTFLLICTAISGGNLGQRLQEAANAHGGAPRLALDVQRLRRLMERKSPSVFFSQELCARYFTYSQNGEAHFVLFDDADTISQKLRTGAEMGFAAAFLMWPEVKDIIGKIGVRN